MAARAMNETERRAILERVGFNVFNLDPYDVELDFFTDIPPHVMLPAEGSGDSAHIDQPDPDLNALAKELYGSARYQFLVRGRAAEAALASAMGDAVKTVIVTHGLFKSTERAFERCGAKVEVCPGMSPERPTSDIDPAWLSERLKAGGAGIVFLEPNNNGLGGRPLTLENVQEVKRICQRHGALLMLDTTRLFANVAALGATGASIIETARRYTELSDLFVMSCAKEFLVPSGALAGVRSADLEKKIYGYAFTAGTMLEPVAARAHLARGMAAIKKNPDLVARRVRQIEGLAKALKARGVPCLEPSGGHAVFVRVDRLMAPNDPLRPRALEALLYRASGVRAYIWAYPAFGRIMRLALPIDCYSDKELDRAAAAVADLFEHAGEAMRLEETPGDHLSELTRRFAPARETS